MVKKPNFKGIEINNFKSFKNFKTDNFGQINLITGKNNSGKTTLLEALYLNLGPTNPHLWLNINARRGLDRLSPKQSTAPYLFYNLDTKKNINFSVHTIDGEKNDLTIKFSEPNTFPFDIIESKQDQISHSSSIQFEEPEKTITIEIVFSPFQGKKLITRINIEPNVIKFEGDSNIPVYTDSVFVSKGGNRLSENETKRYDDLNKENKIEFFNDALRIIEPQLIRTSLGIENERTIIYADFGYGLVPISTSGSGTEKLASIILSLSYAQHGVVLIDEIENSLHYSMQRELWLLIADTVKKNDCQFFATTHSKDCIESAINIFGENKEFDFRLHRLDKFNNKVNLFTFNRNELKTVIETDWEVR